MIKLLIVDNKESAIGAESFLVAENYMIVDLEKVTHTLIDQRHSSHSQSDNPKMH
jgi:hypothetical protein